MTLARRNLSLALLSILPCRGVASSWAFTAVYREVVPRFEHKTQYTIVTSCGASTRGAADPIPMLRKCADPVDVMILARPALKKVVIQGKVPPASCVELVRSSIGMAVRAGGRKPDISSIVALLWTRLEGKSIAYSERASSVDLSTELFQRLGIAGQILPNSKRIAGPVGDTFARGNAEIGFQQISALLRVAGMDYVGPLPLRVQKVTVFSAAVAPSPAIEKSGLEAVAHL